MTKTAKLLGFLLGMASVVMLIQFLVIFNIARLEHTNLALNAKTLRGSSEDGRYESLHREIRTRAALYDELITRDMLLDGMVVNRSFEGKAIDLCDSLLFSSIRYRSLVALGFSEEADRAWNAILHSRNGGNWWRHPKCRKQSLSRDMIMGLLVALQAFPSEGKNVLTELLGEIERRNGSVSNGPFFISYLSPGPAGLLRNYAEQYEIPWDQWPWVVQQSFSSVEFDAMFLKPGYQSHLAALGLWLEHRFSRQRSGFNPRSLLGQLERLTEGLRANHEADLDVHRRRWIANTLVQQNPGNLFFRILQMDVEQLLSDNVRLTYINELLAMPQFPATRLPRNCDRKADYMWQRAQEEYAPRSDECTITFAGVDFLWAAAFLVGDYDQ